jgi:hypothetical protein
VKLACNILLWFYGGIRVPTRSIDAPWLEFEITGAGEFHKQSIISSRAAAGSNFSGHLIFFGLIFLGAIPAACR